MNKERSDEREAKKIVEKVIDIELEHAEMSFSFLIYNGVSLSIYMKHRQFQTCIGLILEAML